MKEPLYKAIVPKGTHLANSRNTEGSYRGGLLNNDTNQVAGQAEFVKVDYDEIIESEHANSLEDEHINTIENEYNNDKNNNLLENTLLISAGIGIGIAACKAYPHIKNWCKNTFASKSKGSHCNSSDQKFSTSSENTNGQMPNYIKNFNIALHTYLDASEKGYLNIEIIDNVIASLDEVKSNSDTGNISIEFSISQLTTIMDMILNNTNKLAERKLIRLDAFVQPLLEDTSELGRLKHCLEVQKEILEVA